MDSLKECCFQVRLPSSRTGILAILTILSVHTVKADTGIVFSDIAQDPGVGINYSRTPSLTNDVLNAFKQQPLFLDFSDPSTIPNLAQLPEETRGFPGVAIFDYDGYGDLDLYVTNGPGTSNSLLSNQLKESGKLSFKDMGALSGAGLHDKDSSGVCFGDIDNDGDEDLLVLDLADTNSLFENKGDGTFEDITPQSGIATDKLNSTSCSFGDVNSDGLLDVVIANSLPMDNTFAWWIEPFVLNQHNELYVNKGANRFENVSGTSGIQELAGLPPAIPHPAGVTWSIAMVDYDQDGDVDIITADDQVFTLPPSAGGVNRGLIHIFNNDGTGHFTDVSVESGTAKGASWMGLSFGDFNSDGFMDMFATNAGDYAQTMFRGFIGAPYSLGEYASRWFLGQADGSFIDPGVGPDLVATPFAWGTSTLDYNNDGDTDIVFYGNIDVGLATMASNPGAIIQNDGDGNFHYDSRAIPKNHTRRNVHGLATGDLNGDGFVDIVSVSSFDSPEPIPQVPMGVLYGGPFDEYANFIPNFASVQPGVWSWTGIVYPNGSLAVEMNSADNGNHWVEVTAKGTIGITPKGRVNRDAIGAIIKFTPEDGKTVMQPVLGGSSHLSQDSLAHNFGLADEDEGMVEVLWPGGVRNRLYDVHKSERIVFPEIPCSYMDNWGNRRDYAECVNKSLKKIVKSGLLERKDARRFLKSAMKAFAHYRHKHHETETS